MSAAIVFSPATKGTEGIQSTLAQGTPYLQPVYALQAVGDLLTQSAKWQGCGHTCIFLVRRYTACVRYFRQCKKITDLYKGILEGSFLP